jgi:PST family polysaccharide transporter
MMGEFGVGAAVVTLRDLTEEQISQLNSLAVLTGIAGFLISCALAGPLASFFHFAGFRTVFIVMSAGFIISSLQSIPSALLQREMRFKSLSLIDGARSGILAIFSVILAAAGFRYWTLVLSGLLGSILSTWLTLRQRKHSFAWPRIQSLRRTLRFSGDIVGSRVAWYCYSNADFVVAGRRLGEAALGAYTFAWTMAHIPEERITGLLNTVIPAFFSAIQQDLISLRRYILNVTQMLAFLTFPTAAGISLLSGDFVEGALGPKWRGAVVPLQLLAIYVPVRTITPLLAYALNATGETRKSLWLSLLQLATFPPAFYLASRWGTTGIAAVWIVLHPLFSVLLLRMTLRKIQLPTRDYLQALYPPIVGTAFMILAVSLVKVALPSSCLVWLRLGAEIVSGVVVYSGTVLLLFKDRFWAAFRRVRASY